MTHEPSAIVFFRSVATVLISRSDSSRSEPVLVRIVQP